MVTFPSVGLSPEELTVGLAEECGELAQAACKLHRALNGLNPTQINKNTAIGMIVEELGDVLLYLDQLGINPEDAELNMKFKYERWVERLATAAKGFEDKIEDECIEKGYCDLNMDKIEEPVETAMAEMRIET